MHRGIFLVPLLAGVVAMSGCGPKHVAVKGVVKVDGNPVEGAMVNFIADDGKSYGGMSDASGNFALSGPDQKSGVPAGTYKVVVIKTPKVAPETAAESGTPADLTQAMQKAGKEGLKMAGKASGGPMAMKGMPPAKGAKVKSDLPIVYANRETTPLTVTVPSETEPLVLELKSKP